MYIHCPEGWGDCAEEFWRENAIDSELLSHLVKVCIDLWKSNQLKALGDSKNVTAFSALYLWQYLTNENDLKISSSQDTQGRL